MSALQSYEWPGNVRELQHVIEWAVILTRAAARAFEEESLASTPADELHTLDETLEDAERAHIQKALEMVGWRVSEPRGPAKVLIERGGGGRSHLGGLRAKLYDL
ncbi:MAG: hypothetical protein ACREU9_11205 [Gammaproteobacteria bacterium]